jgi:enoyl-CoA hydratase/carnithine racemase
MTDASAPLLIENDGPVRILTLNNPDMLNAMTDELHEALTDVWMKLSRDREARAVIITGAGRAFSAGGNLPAFNELTEDLEARRINMRTARHLVEQILGSHLPIIAAVNGPAVGLGCSIATACDLVLIADDTFIADPHVNVGLVAGDGGVVTWPFLMSMLRVKEYIFTGERIPAAMAVELGLANRAVPKDQLLDEARKLAHTLAEKPAQALQESKRALNIHLQKAALAVLPFALAAESESFVAPEVLAAAAAFREKKA